MMVLVTISRDDFRQDRQGRTFADVLDDPEQPFDELLAFFNSEDRQRRMAESEIHHDRPALAGVVRELESLSAVHEFVSSKQPHRAKRLRQAVGVLVRMIMERLGFRKTGRKGSLGVRARTAPGIAGSGAHHNSGGLAFWFLRAERYERQSGMPFVSVRSRAMQVKNAAAAPASSEKQR
jgi:hypothetical protein